MQKSKGKSKTAIPYSSIGASKSLKENVSSDLDTFEMVNPLSDAGVAFEHHSAGDTDADMEECFDAMDRVGLSEEQAHSLMDVMTDEDDGHIDKLHLLEVLKNWKIYENFFAPGQDVHDAAGRQAWKELDADGDGNVTFEEFQKGMKDKLGVLCPKSTVLRERYDDIIKSI